MLNDFKSILTRCSGTLAEDAAGAAALIVMLIVGLNIPAFS